VASDRVTQTVERPVPTGVVETLEHPTHQADDEIEGDARTGPEAHRRRQPVETDIDKAG
jgi:hypothetical protein